MPLMACRAIARGPWPSNLGLSCIVDTHESSMMRSVKELVEKGVVVKRQQPDGKIAYSINSDYRTHAVSASQLLLKNDLPEVCDVRSF